MIYINPYFSNITENFIRNNYFEEGVEKGYFIKNKDGSPYLIRSVSIHFATVDLVNPDARVWIKNIIKENMIKEA